jgi:hypothetical protein
MLLLVVRSHSLEAMVEYACQLSRDMPKRGAFPHSPRNQVVYEGTMEISTLMG